MGSKTPEGHQQVPHDSISKQSKPAAVPKSRNAGTPDDDLGGDNSDDDDDDDDAHREVAVVNNGVANDGKKKKRKRNKKKSKKSFGAANGLKNQSSPPRTPLLDLFPNEDYPVGELQPYDEGSTSRITGEELRYLSRQMDGDFLRDYRKAAEVHRQVRQHARTLAKPGQSLTVLANEIEDGVRALIDHQGLEPGDSLKAGMGFPTGLALNECAAHWTPAPHSNERFLEKDDVLKIDFGVHVGGRIVDSAFTVAFEEKWDPLLAAAREATNTGIKHAGIDARICDISSAIQETMESYEVEINGKTFPVKSVRNITGHDIQRYRIHGDKQIPFIKNNDQTKMEEGEVFAIETFGTTGKGVLRDAPGIYGYGINPDAPRTNLHLASARSLLKTIDQQFGTIVFCRRYIERLGIEKYILGLNSLVSHGIVQSYAPLNDVPGSHVAQFEHTILLRPEAKEVVSRGDDY
ncbi:MAG: blue light receptor [Chaenotheca gracillima]|nr:MAG: blue light receptor [Chaenotheca gracillima]